MKVGPFAGHGDAAGGEHGTPAQSGKDQHIMIPGWPYSFVVASETGRSSWTAPLDALRRRGMISRR
ncbi:hypothetical protein ACWDRB_50220 [Nonomuraea sp. NPDC003707]